MAASREDRGRRAGRRRIGQAMTAARRTGGNKNVEEGPGRRRERHDMTGGGVERMKEAAKGAGGLWGGRKATERLGGDDKASGRTGQAIVTPRGIARGLGGSEGRGGE